MFSFPFHPFTHVLCSGVTAANANMGQLPAMCSIMNSFSKIPINTPLVFQELKSSKQLPTEDLSCWNLQSLNENGTKQMDNIIESKCFPTDVPVGEETFILLLLWLLWIDMLVGISSLCMTFPRTKLWPQTMCRFGERNFPSHVIHILISFRNMLTHDVFFPLIGIMIKLVVFIPCALWKVIVMNINHKVICVVANS